MNDPLAASPESSYPRSVVPGVLLIAIGFFFLAVNFLDIEFAAVWPVVLLAPALAFFFMVARDRRQFGLLMPATILFIFSLLFFYCQAEGWYMLRYLWPVFMLAPGLGFFLLYLVGRRDAGLLVPAAILTGLSCVFLLVNHGYGHLWPVVLILAGLLLLIRRKPEVPGTLDPTAPMSPGLAPSGPPPSGSTPVTPAPASPAPPEAPRGPSDISH